MLWSFDESSAAPFDKEIKQLSAHAELKQCEAAKQGRCNASDSEAEAALRGSSLAAKTRGHGPTGLPQPKAITERSEGVKF